MTSVEQRLGNRALVSGDGVASTISDQLLTRMRVTRLRRVQPLLMQRSDALTFLPPRHIPTALAVLRRNAEPFCAVLMIARLK